MTPAQFRTRFPEFVSASNEMVSAYLTSAALEMNEDIWGDRYDEGQAYLAAHKMALSPSGQAAKMVPQNNVTSTVYWTHYMRLVRIVTGGYRVVP